MRKNILLIVVGMFLISGCTNAGNTSKILEHSPEQEEQIKEKPSVLELKNEGADSQNSNENEASTQPHKEVTDITQLPDHVDLSFTPLELEGLERGEKLKSWERLKSISLGSIKGKSITLHIFDETNQDNLCSAPYETISLIEFKGDTYKLPDCTSASLKDKKLKQTVFTSKDLKQENHEQTIVAGVELAANGPGRMLYMVYDFYGKKLWSFEDWGLPKVVDLDHSGEKEFINQFQGLQKEMVVRISLTLMT